MVRAALVILVCLLGSARADVRTEPTGFDHTLHARDVDVSAAPAIPCTRCHAVKGGTLVGKPGHAACFGSCHGPAPKPRQSVPADRLRLCNPCHAESQLPSAKPPVTYPPYTRDRDFALQIGHKSHAQVACTQCHATLAAKRVPGPPHRRCAGCHDGSATKAFAMGECATCHTPGSGQPEPPKLLVTAQTQIFVTTAFSHRKHATRGAAKQCTTCHGAIVKTDDRQLPRPAAEGCAITACHDGNTAFPITAACTKCHQDEPKTKYEVYREFERFSHATHDFTNLPCAACHPLSKTGEVQVSGHSVCADSACHRAEFTKRESKKCGACHNGSEPWRKLVADRLPAITTEFGANLDHGKHPGACTTCHSLTTRLTELRPARGHRACSDAKCHAIQGGPAPQLTACEGCHRRGLADERQRLRLATTWSVRAKFVHAPHLQSRGADVACTRCHTDMTSQLVLGLAVPTKATCAPCHDGDTAFKLTGTTCTRCHPGVAR
ncbi:MAG TPA: cytochrome c3 family protein [Kofleriaceae bacterium]|nr:cytochrome c3 family protein [Kofleriaceae bacterium]